MLESKVALRQLRGRRKGGNNPWKLREASLHVECIDTSILFWMDELKTFSLWNTSFLPFSQMNRCKTKYRWAYLTTALFLKMIELLFKNIFRVDWLQQECTKYYKRELKYKTCADRKRCVWVPFLRGGRESRVSQIVITATQICFAASALLNW